MTHIGQPSRPDVREVGVTCHCGDPTVERLRDLIAQGIPQVEASRQLWGTPVPVAPPLPDPPRARFRWIGARERST